MIFRNLGKDSYSLLRCKRPTKKNQVIQRFGKRLKWRRQINVEEAKLTESSLAPEFSILWIFPKWIFPKIGGENPPKWMVKIMVPNPMNTWMIWGGFCTPIFLETTPKYWWKPTTRVGETVDSDKTLRLEAFRFGSGGWKKNLSGVENLEILVIVETLAECFSRGKVMIFFWEKGRLEFGEMPWEEGKLLRVVGVFGYWTYLGVDLDNDTYIYLLYKWILWAELFVRHTHTESIFAPFHELPCTFFLIWTLHHLLAAWTRSITFWVE